MGKSNLDVVIESFKDSTEPANEKYQEWLAGGGKKTIERNTKWLYFIFGCFAAIISLVFIDFIRNDGIGQLPLWFCSLTGIVTILLFARGLRMEAKRKKLVRARNKELYRR